MEVIEIKGIGLRRDGSGNNSRMLNGHSFGKVMDRRDLINLNYVLFSKKSNYNMIGPFW